MACTTARDSVTGNPTGTQPSLGLNSGDVYDAFNFVAGSTYTLCKITMQMGNQGSPTFTMTASIYTDNAGSPGTLIGTASSSVNASSLSNSFASINFVSLSASLVSGTTYWVVFKQTGSANDSANCVRWGALTGSTFASKTSSNGTSWVSVNTTINSLYATFSDPSSGTITAGEMAAAAQQFGMMNPKETPRVVAYRYR